MTPDDLAAIRARHERIAGLELSTLDDNEIYFSLQEAHVDRGALLEEVGRLQNRLGAIESGLAVPMLEKAHEFHLGRIAELGDKLAAAEAEVVRLRARLVKIKRLAGGSETSWVGKDGAKWQRVWEMAHEDPEPNA